MQKRGDIFETIADYMERLSVECSVVYFRRYPEAAAEVGAEALVAVFGIPSEIVMEILPEEVE